MEKFLDYLKEAEEITKTADHLIYTTYPLVQDKRILLKIILELKKSLAYCINSILQYEYIYKRIKLTTNPKTNLLIFEQKCAHKYKLSKKDTILIQELFEIAEKHQKSSMEFMKNDKLVILSENSSQKVISIEKIKEFLELSKQLTNNAKSEILR